MLSVFFLALALTFGVHHRQGHTTLAVHAESADIISSIIKLTTEIEEAQQTKLKVTIVGAAEAHLVAVELGKAGIGVILNPARPFPATWQQRRMCALFFLLSLFQGGELIFLSC